MRQRNFGNGNAWRMARNRNVRVVNTWRSNQFAGSAYAPFRNYARVYHNHGWYHDHYSDTTFVLGGWWYWNAGYWYPAWGYAPYSYYPYDGPIYTGYASLTPDRVSIEVQRQLQQDGYYAGPIDGSIGPMTRRALAAFQADNGLAVTSAIDQPTLATLGIS
jgi:N-acetylmuramoyl-L-alanine amidase